MDQTGGTIGGFGTVLAGEPDRDRFLADMLGFIEGVAVECGPGDARLARTFPAPDRLAGVIHRLPTRSGTGQARQVGLAIATERSQASMHENGLRASGVYSVEGSLNKEQHDRLTEWLKQKSGPEKTGAPLVLDRNAKWTSTALNGVDAQHVETRRLQVEEICRAFNVFPIMVGHSDKTSTFASSEAFFGAHVKQA